MKVKLKANHTLVSEIQSYLNYLHDARTQGLAQNQIAGFGSKHASAAQSFHQAYAEGGLGGVDDLIDSINEVIKESGGTKGFREGCGLENGSEGRPDFLIIMFVDFTTDRVIAQEAIPV